MKKIFYLTLVLLSITFVAFSQCPENGQNITRPDLDKFAGIWKYSANGTVATLMLKKIHRRYVYYNEIFYDDMIAGVIKIVTNGIVIFDNTNEFSNASIMATKSKLVLNYDCINNLPDKIKGTLRDVVKQKSVGIEISFIAGNTPEISVFQSNPERGVVYNLNGSIANNDIRNPAGTFDPDFTLPTNVNFIKQP